MKLNEEMMLVQIQGFKSLLKEKENDLGCEVKNQNVILKELGGLLQA